jgi:hypothetical protein
LSVRTSRAPRRGDYEPKADSRNSREEEGFATLGQDKKPGNPLPFGARSGKRDRFPDNQPALPFRQAPAKINDAVP